MGSTICTAGFPSAAIASSCFTARCDSIWYGFFIATLLFLGKRNCSQPIKGFERGSRYFLRSTGHSPCRSALCSFTAFSNSPRENSFNTCEKMLHTFIRLSLLWLSWSFRNPIPPYQELSLSPADALRFGQQLAR